MTALLGFYHVLTRVLEPAAPWLIERRLKTGKERAERIGERFGLTETQRPAGPLIWMHGASVGESRLLMDLFAAIRAGRPDATALVTTQTLTSADLIAGLAPPGVIHQMAPVDGPAAVERFMTHWRPDAAVFAEGEIWPNMLAALRASGTPTALVNARMTARTLSQWKARRPSAREVFSTFTFIGAADAATAAGLRDATGQPIAIIGNLKLASGVAMPAKERVDGFREAVGNRRMVLAASTHPGEDEFALEAFTGLRMRAPGALLVIAPRHPERGDAIAALTRGRGFTTQQRSRDAGWPTSSVDVLVADTMGELVFWYVVADSVYLGGATAPDVGGHNAIEAAQVGKHVFTGPHGYNFREVFAELQAAGGMTVGSKPAELADYWLDSLSGTRPGGTFSSLFAGSREPFDATVATILGFLRGRAAHA